MARRCLLGQEFIPGFRIDSQLSRQLNPAEFIPSRCRYAAELPFAIRSFVLAACREKKARSSSLPNSPAKLNFGSEARFRVIQTSRNTRARSSLGSSGSSSRSRTSSSAILARILQPIATWPSNPVNRPRGSPSACHPRSASSVGFRSR